MVPLACMKKSCYCCHRPHVAGCSLKPTLAPFHTMLLQVANAREGPVLGRAASGRLLTTFQQLSVPAMSKPQLYR